MKLHLRDISQALVGAWSRAFEGVADVEISRGDIFSMREGPLPGDAPIDVKADAVVSPANSFGFMDGGIDAVYTYVLGDQVQARAQDTIRREYDGELPVGCAFVVPTGRPELPWCVIAPTMRVPEPVPDSVNAYLALRAALIAARRQSIGTLLCPGLATSVGRMPVDRCARQMRRAWDEFVAERPFPRSVGEATRWHDALLRP